ncbi:2-nitropropane dioxygenase [Nibricoccus aquaticus]|uniref:2-nitropropane dioxygenase n=1 Tax=Nibricoccus aquaticus TaxID=2576891 RepID=A0A290Q451_9BACT|nr:nitronate monooxygenase [Nibricoccus aquaticus]ATC63445.1 2-nitropropane dioxygenase [Nibricoccus aquaticus]
MTPPIIIQGGMGVAVSSWRLARAVSLTGQLGVVSGTLLPVVQTRRLQQGDPSADLRHAFDHFPIPEIADRVWREFYVPGGLPLGAPFKLTPLPTLESPRSLIELTVLACFAEVFLAKEGHTGPIGINLLEKIQLPTLPSLYGAMLAGVDYVLMGAGIPRSIPGILDAFSRSEPASLKIDIEGSAPDAPDALTHFNPRILFSTSAPALHRPRFLAIVSSATLALTLAKKSTGQVDGFVVEGSVAGGHNAPPRGALQLSASGEPIYGPRDLPDLPKFRDLGLPFWLAGAFSSRAKIDEARALGAAGVQVGTAFALCDESGIFPDLKRRLRELIRTGSARVHTDPLASPTGFPFKIAQLSQTLSDAVAYAKRPRICDLGYLRQLFRRPDGTVGYRCAAEPVADFVRKGGQESDTVNRKCLCNGLAATVGLAQTRHGETELPLITAGDDIAQLARFFRPDRDTYTAADIIHTLLNPSIA